ncbi:MAG: ABC transporter ATP-binding protein [Dehalococcoidia bacterium]|nr:ABC transporter ATP-binding protein [Dehalococcoidia bacterium]MDW8119282.1 ABC transporter ATP-binding protein [Chloroflexota bacterium]
MTPLLEVRNLHTHFFTREGVVKAVNGVSFSLQPGQTLGLVGESGSGKTVTALSILRLVPFPGRIVQGAVVYRGRNLLEASEDELRHLRGREIAMVFQNPHSALNPVLPVGVQVEEVLQAHTRMPRKEVQRRVRDLMYQMGLPDPERVAVQYPFQLSGGMAQRVMLAMALCLEPKVLIADEPTSNLDVTLQADILQRLRTLQKERGTAILLITHDMGVVARVAHWVAVMYAGTIVEHGPIIPLFQRPVHPYTWGLFQALPRLDKPDQALRPLRGTPPNLVDLPDQCPFIPRCSKAIAVCRTNPRPPLQEVEGGHWAACYNHMRYE